MDQLWNQVSYLVHGKYALFTDPLTKGGGEKESYSVPTYESLVGITSSIYWKPTIIWVIDQLHVLKPIQMESRGVRPMDYNSPKPNLSYASYLCDVAYEVKAHFEWNKQRPDLKRDWNEDKHFAIANRAINAGGRRDIFLGTRECQGYVEPLTDSTQTSGPYDQIPEIDFGVMFHGFNYPDTNGRNQLDVRFWQAEMKNGVIKFPRPEECQLVRPNLRRMTSKNFDENNFSFVDDE
ncbi:type I-C CRISPR-associated protein Cas5c [Lapidilactobacillus wuchangensis]|uniref:type I-C CRISPR-associated protein Cas5c n=1 Tax=Lapidilactobacillus wuchangensis TaxID=2486001 RepID=UPI000F768E9A|nr:type I-C CRISPR-associated protein Cas5c [Lapidilactobacillus wuchangensis]